METKTNELIQVVEQSGLDKTKGQKITETLSVFFDKAAEWQTTIESLTINSIDEVGKMKTAKEIRLSLKNKRLEGEKLVTAAREIVKNRMADDVLEDKLWLKSGQIMKAVYDNLEGKAEWIEKYAERYEAEQKEIRKSERTAELTPYAEFVPFGIDLGNMSDEDYTKVLEGAKLQLNAKIEAEKKAEAERIEAKRLEDKRIADQEIENQKLKKERERVDKLVQSGFSFDGNCYFVSDFKRLTKQDIVMLSDSEFSDVIKAGVFELERIESEKKAIQDLKDKEAADLLEKQKAEAEAEKIKNDAKLKAERESREKLENELRLKQEDEKAKQLAAEQLAEAEASKGDVEKFETLLNDLANLKTKYSFKSKRFQTKSENVNGLIDKIIDFAKK